MPTEYELNDFRLYETKPPHVDLLQKIAFSRQRRHCTQLDRIWKTKYADTLMIDK